MKFIRVDVKRPGEVEHDLKGLSPAYNQLIAVVAVGMMLRMVLTQL